MSDTQRYGSNGCGDAAHVNARDHAVAHPEGRRRIDRWIAASPSMRPSSGDNWAPSDRAGAFMIRADGSILMPNECDTPCRAHPR